MADFLPTKEADLQKFSISLFEGSEQTMLGPRRDFSGPISSTQVVGTWLNGWRAQLAAPPGMILVIRCAEFVALCQRSPDLMSFAYPTSTMLPIYCRSSNRLRWLESLIGFQTPGTVRSMNCRCVPRPMRLSAGSNDSRPIGEKGMDYRFERIQNHLEGCLQQAGIFERTVEVAATL